MSWTYPNEEDRGRRMTIKRQTAKRQGSDYYRKYWSQPKARMSHLARSAFARARKRGIEYELELKELLCANPPTNCMCCSREFDYRLGQGRANRASSPSLDRLDSSKGYTIANVRVICTDCNVKKNGSSIEDLKRILAYMQSELQPVAIAATNRK